jgi:IclR family acetate operon transcriptional repressor
MLNEDSSARTSEPDTSLNGGSRSVGRALDLLKVVCDEGSISMASAARVASLPASTALRLLRKLEDSGFVRRDERGEFSPGPTLIGLGAQALSRNRLIRSSRPLMRALAVELGESIFLSVRRSDDSCVYIAAAQGTHPIRYENWVGRTFSIEGSADGLLLTGPVPPLGFEVVVGSVDPEVTAIAAPVTIANETFAVMSSLVPSYRLDPKRTTHIAHALVEAAEEFGRTGYATSDVKNR